MVEYKNGNLLQSGCDLICHQVNCQGVMGAGIAKQIRSIHPNVYESYKNLCDKYGCEGVFGTAQMCPISDDSEQYIVNMFAQYNYLPRGINHTNCEGFKSCCKHIKAFVTKTFQNKLVRIGFPDHIGCGLGGGDWSTIKEVIETEFKEPQWRVEIWKLN